MKVDRETFQEFLKQYNGELSIDHSFLHTPPAKMYWDFNKKENQLVAKEHETWDSNYNSIGYEYHIFEEPKVDNRTDKS